MPGASASAKAGSWQTEKEPYGLIICHLIAARTNLENKLPELLMTQFYACLYRKHFYCVQCGFLYVPGKCGKMGK